MVKTEIILGTKAFKVFYAGIVDTVSEWTSSTEMEVIPLFMVVHTKMIIY